jgi:hypothetical protein
MLNHFYISTYQVILLTHLGQTSVAGIEDKENQSNKETDDSFGRGQYEKQGWLYLELSRK